MFTARRLCDNGEEMVACDQCNEWYHSSCESIPAEVFTNSKISWLCNKCLMGGSSSSVAVLQFDLVINFFLV